MLLGKLTDRELVAMDEYRCAYAYSEGVHHSHRAPMTHILKYWNKNKELLFHLFGDKLMVSKNVVIKTPESYLEGKMDRLINSSVFCDWLYRLGNEQFYHDWDQRKVIADLMRPDILTKNKYTESAAKITFTNGKTISVPNGCKPLRILAKIAAEYGKEELFEQFRIDHSMVLNKKELHGELVLSIHPLDYMTMSDNESNWSSCMSWEDAGCYRRGTVEMMNSPMAVVAYLKSDKDMALPGGFYWSNKKWRELILFQDDFITNVKAYPYRSSELSSLAIEMLADLAKENLGWQYDEGTVSYHPFEKFDYNEKRYCLTFETEAMYNDMDSGVRCLVKMRPELPEGTYDTFYSGESECMHCGAVGDFSDYDEAEGNLVCNECCPTYYCADCGERVYEDDVYEVDGNFLCSYCYENHTVETVDDGQIHMEGDTNEVYVVGSVTGLDYTANSIKVYNVNYPDKDFMETYFTVDKFHCHTKGWSTFYYVLTDELTEKGLELFDLDDEETLEEYNIEYSLDEQERYERKVAIRNGEPWPRVNEEELTKLNKLKESLAEALKNHIIGIISFGSEQ